jgi:hypothetical protein
VLRKLLDDAGTRQWSSHLIVPDACPEQVLGIHVRIATFVQVAAVASFGKPGVRGKQVPGWHMEHLTTYRHVP